MKSTTLLFTICIILKAFVINSYALEDEYAKLDITNNKIPIKKYGDAWLRISVPFKFVKHPKLQALQGKRPSTQ